jgi:hypothetical protein
MLLVHEPGVTLMVMVMLPEEVAASSVSLPTKPNLRGHNRQAMQVGDE